MRPTIAAYELEVTYIYYVVTAPDVGAMIVIAAEIAKADRLDGANPAQNTM